MISFLLNANVIDENLFFGTDFSIERKDGVNHIFILNRREAKENTQKWFIKVKKNVSDLSDKLLLKEVLFYDYWKDKAALLGFAVLPKAYNTNIEYKMGLFQNNSISVREFLVGYRDAFRLCLAESSFLNRKKNVIKAADALREFHNTGFDKENLIETLSPFLDETEIIRSSSALKSLPSLNEFKFSPEYIQQFWKILTIHRNVIENWIKISIVPSSKPTLIHGDYRLENILLDEDDNTKHFFIDFEFWHIGDIHWDIVIFLFDLKVQFSQHYTALRGIFLETYNNGTSLIDDRRLKAVEGLYNIQQLYSELTPHNFTLKLQELNDIFGRNKK